MPNPLQNESPLITWSVVVYLIFIAFSSGTAWISIFDNKETDVKQWSRINVMEDTVERHSAQIEMYASMASSISQLSEATTDLKVATEVASRQAKIDAENRVRNDHVMSRLSTDMTNIKIQVGRIEEKLSK